jgi:hypothetical protein
MRNFLFLLAASSIAFAQNPQVASTKGFFEIVKGNVIKSVDKMPEAKLSYKPAEGVRTYGQLLMPIPNMASAGRPKAHPRIRGSRNRILRPRLKSKRR